MNSGSEVDVGFEGVRVVQHLVPMGQRVAVVGIKVPVMGEVAHVAITDGLMQIWVPVVGSMDREEGISLDGGLQGFEGVRGRRVLTGVGISRYVGRVEGQF
jgi:hypothetical protein